MPPLVSAVVPIHNVEPYLRACLDSLLAQSLASSEPGAVEVICVDDGSTDRSGAIADGYAAANPNVRVIHVDNGGLGRARNIGLRYVTGDYIAFVDSDDVVPPDAYERMHTTVAQTGSDFVTGHVLRYDGTRTWRSALHAKAISATVLRTHIRAMPSLLYDTTVWNKLFRRSFWDTQGLTFPEDVFWEDIRVAIPAHVLVSAVDVLNEPVYWWRQRQHGSRSITQRRIEVKNLEDRIRAARAVNDFLVERDERELKKHHDRRVLAHDVQLYVAAMLAGDEHYQRRFVELVGDYLGITDEAVLRGLTPLDRLKYHLVRAGDTGRLVQVLDYQMTRGHALPVRKGGLRLLAQPPCDDSGIPKDVLDVSRVVPMRAGVDAVAWERGRLVVEGFAYIEKIGLPTPVSALRRVQLRETGGSRVVDLWPLPRLRPDVTAGVAAADVSYTWSGFRAVVDPRRLAPAPGQQEASWEVVVRLLTPWARRSIRLGPPRRGATKFPTHAIVAPGLTVVPTITERERLTITVRRDDVVARAVRVAAEQLHVEGVARAGPGDLAGAVLAAYDQRGQRRVGPAVEAGRLTAAGQRSFAAWLPLAGIVAGDRALPATTWDLALQGGGLTRGRLPLTLAPEQGEVAAAVDTREVLARAGAAAHLQVLDRPPVLVARHGWFADDGTLHLSGRLVGDTVTAAIEVRHRVFGRHRFPLEHQGERFTARLAVFAVEDLTGRHPLHPGAWQLWGVLNWADGTASEAPVTFERGAIAGLERVHRDASTRIALRGDKEARLNVRVLAAPDRERGGWNQKRLRSVHYRLDRRLRRVQDVVLFESCRGKQYSDNPRAISEELRRRGDPRQQVWVVENDTVPVPPGVRRVRRGSRDYYAALATARYVVTNDSMPPFYVKREATTYVQTWHGTPLKRTGFDLEPAKFRNRRFLDEWALDTCRWDHLISPNPFTTETMRRAFRYDGDVVETGYPRNDLLQAADREERAAQVRRRLRIPEGARVILYAPTWRDDAYDRAGRYRQRIMFDADAMASALGEDHVLLFRAHHLTAATTSVPSGGFLRDVTRWPDIAELYLVADVLVTDYSSAMFDFANTGRPMLFFTYDLDRYRDRVRGFTFDFEASAPGPVLREGSELVAALKDVDAVHTGYRERYDAFAARFCPYDDGHASQRVVDRLFGR